LASAPDSDGAKPAVNREVLAKLTRRPTSLRAITNCFSGQLVYLISGTRRNIVSSYIPVVGSIERPDDDSQFASITNLNENTSSRKQPRIMFTQSGGGAQGGGSNRSVGYHPVTENPNSGALLPIRPTLTQGDPAAVVDLKSTLPFPAEQTDAALQTKIAA